MPLSAACTMTQKIHFSRREMNLFYFEWMSNAYFPHKM